MSSCQHHCDKTSSFPKDVFNRPGLASIKYRIGAYSSMREHMLDLLNKSPQLSRWTHRGADDPGIAILEGAAIVGDILTFYQNLYANEAFLRTAEWRESVAELVQILGYRLAPGVGGEATFALKIKGEKSVIVPQGFGLKAKLENQDEDSVFETTKEITAHPHLSEFNLYSPSDGAKAISSGSNQLELLAVGNKSDLNTLTGFEISKGDRLMLIPDAAMFDNNSVSYTPQDKAEILIVSEVETILNRIIISFEGKFTVNRGNSVTAYVIDRTFRHFGHNAASKLNTFDGTDLHVDDTEFNRWVNATDIGNDFYSTLVKKDMPLSQEVDDLALGGFMICQGLAQLNDHTVSPSVHYNNVSFTVIKEIQELRADTLRWSSLEGATTVVTLKTRLMSNYYIFSEKMDIKKALFHEVVSPKLTLGALSEWTDGQFSDGDLQFFGTYKEVKKLAERDLLLVDSQKEIVQRVAVDTTSAELAAYLSVNSFDKKDKWMWDITLDQKPQFLRQEFSQKDPRIIVYGNPVEADQGKTEKEVILGSGDNRKTFQTFVISKTPLTYLLDESQTPAQVPELAIYVEAILWKKVDNFFNSASDDQVYVLREDKDGNSFVQFGDGKTGMRLPSGKNNVTALFRSGIGASGSLEAEAKPKAVGKLKELEDVFMPAPAVGGGEAESEDVARLAAPGKLQSLDRLVGLADYESEVLALPGVIKVRADWAAPNSIPQVQIVVLTKTGSTAAVDKVRNTMLTYNRCRGAARFPVSILQGLLQYIYLNIRAGYNASCRKKDMKKAIQKALGLVGEEGNGITNDKGLFGIKSRRFGQRVHVSQIMAAVQQVDGITWVKIKDAQLIELGSPPETDPIELSKPSIASTAKEIACLPSRILTLHSLHLDLSLEIEVSDRECS